MASYKTVVKSGLITMDGTALGCKGYCRIIPPYNTPEMRITLMVEMYQKIFLK